MLRAKIVWWTAHSVFIPCGLNIGDATSLKMIKLWRRRLIAGIIILRASKSQEIKIHKSRNLCEPQGDSKTILLDIWSSGTSHCQLASSETHMACSQKSWHSFAGLFSGLVFRTALQLPSPLWLPFVAVFWCSSHETIWLEWSAIVVLGTGRWPDHFFPPCTEK